MDETDLRTLLDDVANGRTSTDDAARLLRRLPFADLGFARIDHHRALRQGLPEAVYAPGKAPEHCGRIVEELLTTGGPVVLSRADDAQVRACPGGGVRTDTGRGLSTVVWNAAPSRPERVMVACAGTADLAIGDECAATLTAYGVQPIRLSDCGVAGLHRLLPHVDEVATADAIVAVAGMEGALASVLGGIAPCPVVAVPTSVGYGASLEGVTALLAMLSSCAAGVTVVGIDNGYGAAVAVARLLGGRERTDGRNGATDPRAGGSVP